MGTRPELLSEKDVSNPAGCESLLQGIPIEVGRIAAEWLRSHVCDSRHCMSVKQSNEAVHAMGRVADGQYLRIHLAAPLIAALAQ